MTDIVAEARTWIGTPYVHQAAVKGVATDCLGMIRGLWRYLYGEDPRDVPAYSSDWGEPQQDERLWRSANDHFCDVSDQPMAPGHVILFRMRDGGIAKHLGVIGEIGDQLTFIHAYAGHGVTESPLSGPWQRRIVARFAFLPCISNLPQKSVLTHNSVLEG
jgi:NlpC/P60 family putative phage cell wall peptidase